jgi:hypothetical protein
VHLNNILHKRTDWNYDREEVGYGELKQALKEIEKKYLGMQWEVGTIIVVGKAQVSILYAFEGMALSQIVKAVVFDSVTIGISNYDAEDKMARIFPCATVEWRMTMASHNDIDEGA